MPRAEAVEEVQEGPFLGPSLGKLSQSELLSNLKLQRVLGRGAFATVGTRRSRYTATYRASVPLSMGKRPSSLIIMLLDSAQARRFTWLTFKGAPSHAKSSRPSTARRRKQLHGSALHGRPFSWRRWSRVGGLKNSAHMTPWAGGGQLPCCEK